MMAEALLPSPWSARRPELVALGASAGGIDALLHLLGALAPRNPLRVAVVLHLPQQHDSMLPSLFTARLSVPALEACHGMPAEPGRVVFAPPGYHLVVEADLTFSLSCDAPVLFSRPSIDVLFDSCADALGPQAAGIVLTGANEDGAEGLARIKRAGGLALVQEPREAAHPAMPLAAIGRAAPHAVLPLERLHALLAHWGKPQ